MKIYVLVDMEGISGIRLMSEVKSESAQAYRHGCTLMAREVNLVIDAAFESGATAVTVCDTHSGGGQLSLGELDARAMFELPAGRRLMPSLSEQFDGVFLIGHHAMAGTQNGFLDHTFNSNKIFEMKLNGRTIGEIGSEAAYAAQWGVPVLLVSGDAATAVEACETLGDVTTAVVKWGLGRNRARCMEVSAAHALLRQRVGEAIQQKEKRKPFPTELPATVQITYYRSDYADHQEQHGGWQRLDARTVQKTVQRADEIHPL